METEEKFYRVPLKERSTELGAAILNHRLHGCTTITTKIGKTGIFVGYDEEGQIFDENFIKRHLIGIGDTHAIVPARSVKDAVETFYHEWYGANVGGESYESRALYINVSEPIIEFPSCSLIHQDKNGRYECGEIENGHGVYGGCVLEEYDQPEGFFCPICSFLSSKVPREFVRRIMVGGVEYSYIAPGNFYQMILARTGIIKEEEFA